MNPLFSVTSMLARGGTPAERSRTRLMAVGAALATWFCSARRTCSRCTDISTSG